MTTARRIGLVGLQTTHAFADARSLSALDRFDFAVIETDEERVGRFLGEWPTAVRFDSVDALSDWRPDGVVVTEQPARVAALTPLITSLTRAVFINKPAAITHHQVELLDAAIVNSHTPVFSTSVLRAAAAVPAMPAVVRGDVRIRIEHNLGWWRNPSSRWQDDPRVGGGIVGALGLHALELAAIVIGDDFAVTEAWTECRYAQGLNADHAEIRFRWPSGATGVAELIADAVPERYRVWVDDREVVDLPAAGRDPLGYERTAQALLEAIESGVAPVKWGQTRRILASLASALEMAQSSR